MSIGSYMLSHNLIEFLALYKPLLASNFDAITYSVPLLVRALPRYKNDNGFSCTTLHGIKQYQCETKVLVVGKTIYRGHTYTSPYN